MFMGGVKLSWVERVGAGKRSAEGPKPWLKMELERRGFWLGRRGSQGRVIRLRTGCGASALGELGRGLETSPLDG
jgi:hypothetical protein